MGPNPGRFDQQGVWIVDPHTQEAHSFGRCLSPVRQDDHAGRDGAAMKCAAF